MREGPRPTRWNGALVALHWVAAALILELLIHGWLMVHGGFSAATTFDLYQWHKSLGFVVLALTAARLAARALTRAPPELPAPVWEKRLAALVQASLYLLTLLIIAAGWLAVSTSPLPDPDPVLRWVRHPTTSPRRISRCSRPRRSRIGSRRSPSRGWSRFMSRGL